MSSFDPRPSLRSNTERSAELLRKDLNAIPEDKLLSSPGGSARNPLNIVAECAQVNFGVAKYLATGEATPRPPSAEWQAHLNSFDTREKVLALLGESVEKLAEVLDGLDVSRFDETTNFPFGSPVTRYFLAELPAIHMMYHDGQLNYVHSLYGDTQIHW